MLEVLFRKTGACFSTAKHLHEKTNHWGPEQLPCDAKQGVCWNSLTSVSNGVPYLGDAACQIQMKSSHWFSAAGSKPRFPGSLESGLLFLFLSVIQIFPNCENLCRRTVPFIIPIINKRVWVLFFFVCFFCVFFFLNCSICFVFQQSMARKPTFGIKNPFSVTWGLRLFFCYL